MAEGSSPQGAHALALPGDHQAGGAHPDLARGDPAFAPRDGAPRAGVILLPPAKGGARPVILNEVARKILQARLESHEKAWVFPSPGAWPIVGFTSRGPFERPPERRD